MSNGNRDVQWGHLGKYAEVADADRPVEIIQQMDEIVGPIIAGKRVIDAGCGAGQFSVRYARLASQVVAYDTSSELLAKTRLVTAGTPNIIVTDDLAGLDMTAQPAQVAVLNAVLLTVPSVEQVNRLLALVTSKMTDDGVLVIADPHPCFRQYAVPGKVTTFKPENYLTPGSEFECKLDLGDGKSVTFPDSHYSVGQYVQFMRKAGFKLLDIHEISHAPQSPYGASWMVMVAAREMAR
jgi:SAM-dependent methyltransferase